MELSVTLTKQPKQKPADESKLGFGKIFTDHMFVMDYDPEHGWHNAQIVPYGPLEILPACTSLHYSQSVFEGLKAYRTKTGEIRLFRPTENFKRLNNSNRRLCIPEIDEAFALEALKKLLEIDREWVPKSPGTSLYVRPFVFATEEFLGVHPSSHYKFIIILSPSGAYYASGLNPVGIYVERHYVRAVRGGTGEVKAGANYAISLKAQDEAEKEGYSQVLWLDGVEQKYIEEVGAMNVFFVIGDEIVTPALRGSILPGITRKSAIELLQHWGYQVVERPLAVDELTEAYRDGRLREAFGTGTAAVISPIGKLKIDDLVMELGGGKIGEISQKLYDNLTGIQWGELADPFGWSVKVCDV
ncbi:branched-chain amino acid aminotransferase [Feifania hominis]|uniref:Branched-chain-amino-acid aminotransferase n=1 Tax=Feifania hominis TaxID=2763660 RepID=A0A926DCE3_9FIRM|nr:branched-chain amino acid aminotransferase [Feifania hominis]MBC8535297.1 branched-chain amino acid aminotransferase [Feifania hominis]